MEKFRYDTYCGLYCGACDILAAFRKAAENGNPAKWVDIPLEFRKNLPDGGKADIVCYGCKSDTVFAGCTRCPVRKCAKEKMKVAFCEDCRKYPCLRFRALVFFQGLFKKRLPHLKAAKANRAIIKEKGASAWLAQQEDAWKCPKCRMPFTWYKKTCSQCGKELAV
jgi:hypothetical protein